MTKCAVNLSFKEPHDHRQAAERLAVQLQARRRVGLTILHRFLCGGIDSCNGMLDAHGEN